MSERKTMKKNLMKFAALAFAAAGLNLTAFGVGDTGDICSLQAVPVATYGTEGNVLSPLGVGEKFYVRVRLLNEDWILAKTHGKTYQWTFERNDTVIPSDLKDVLFRPGLRLAIGAKKVTALLDDAGPEGEPNGLNPQNHFYTDYYFSYTVKEGELGQPVRLVNAKDEIIDTAEGVGASGFYLVNVTTAGNAGGYWDLTNDCAGEGEERHLANFKYSGALGTMSPSPTSQGADWSYPSDDIAERQSVDKVYPGIFVKTIDFDTEYEVDPTPGDEGVWRYVYQGLDDNVGKAPQITGVGPTTVYIWSDDESVVTPVGEVDTTVADRKVVKVTLKADGSPVSFKLKGGDAAAVGATAHICLCSQNRPAKNGSGDVLPGSYLQVPVKITTAPDPFMSITDADGAQGCETMATTLNQPLQMKVSFSKAFDGADVEVKLNPSVPDSAVDAIGGKYVVILKDESDAPMDLTSITSVTVPKGQKDVYFYLYALGSCKDLASKKLTLAPSVDPTSPAYQFFRPSTEAGLHRSAFVKVTDQKPVAAVTAPSSAYQGDEIAVDVIVSDNWRDLDEVNTNGYKVTVAFDGKTLLTTNGCSFANDTNANTFPVTVPDDADPLATHKILVTVWDATHTGPNDGYAVEKAIEINKKPEYNAYPRFYVSDRSDAAVDTRSVFCEGDEPFLRFMVTNAALTKMYAKLVPANAMSTGLVEAAALERKFAIERGATLSEGIPLRLLDGDAKKIHETVGTFSLALFDAATDAKIDTYRLHDLTFTVTNAAPTVVGVRKGDWNEFDGKVVKGEDGKWVYEASRVPSGVPIVFTVKLADLGLIDATSGTARVYYEWTDGPEGDKWSDHDVAVANTNGVATLNIYGFSEPESEQTVSIYVMDRDQCAASSDPNDFGDVPDLTFTLRLAQMPNVYLFFPKGDDFHETTDYSKTTVPAFYVKLTEFPKGSDAYTDPVTGVTDPRITQMNPIVVRLTVESFDDGGRVNLVTNYVYFKQSRDINNGMPVCFDKFTQNGGDLPSTTFIHAEVMNGNTDAGYPECRNKAGDPWCSYFQSTDTPIKMWDDAPVKLSLAAEGGKDFTANGTNTWTAGETVTLKWTTTDTAYDLTNGNFRVEWSGVRDLNNKSYVTLTNGWPITLASGSPLKATAEGTFSFKVPTTSTEVTVTANDNEGGTLETKFWIRIVPSKKIAVSTYGPAPTTQTKYDAASGLGRGHVYVEGSTGSYIVRQFIQTWDYAEAEQQADLWALGYAASKTPVLDNGELGKSNGYSGAALSPDGFKGDASTGYYDGGSSDYDNFFYRWAQVAGEDGANVTYGTISPAKKPGEMNNRKFDLDNEKKTGSDTYKTVSVEAIFAREKYPSDNMGDIDGDGIPDLYAKKYGYIGTEETEGADLNPQDARNDDDGEGDFLPLDSLTSYGAVLPGTPATWSTLGLPFDAVTEIRGYHWGLNSAPEDDNLGVKADRVYEVELEDGTMGYDPKKCTISELEYMAWKDSGLPAAEWSPECPSDPTKIDTDGDGYPDGYEYFFWYKAHVGYLDGNGRHRYLTGRRFDPQAPSVGRLITPKEIEAIFNPRDPGDKSAALTRDTDNDGLPDLIEFELGTDPLNWDTDGDGLPDGYEVAMLGREAEGGTIGSIASAGERRCVFDPLGNSGVDEAMYNGDADAMAYLPVSKKKVMISGFLQGDGSVRWYWLSGGTNVVSATTTPGFKLVVEETDEEGETTLSTNVTTAAAAALVKPLDGKWVLTGMLTEDECWAAQELAEGLSRGAPSALACGTRLAEAPAACEIVNVTVEGAKGPCYRVWQYGPRVYGEGQPYGQWVCGAETVSGFKDKPCVATQEVNLFNIHTHAYQGVAGGEGAKDAWHPEFGWGEAMPFTQLDEFLVCFWHYLDDQPEATLGGSPMKMTPDRGRSWINIWSDYCTDPSTADTDGDGMPDGWELYVLGGPKAYGEGPGVRKRNYGPLGVNSAKNPTGEFASEFHGSTCSLYFGPYCQTIIDSYLVTHPFWTNKKQPTDPWTDDTDGDGIPDGEEEGLFAYLQETEQWQGREPSYPDAIPAPGAGGGLDPLSWDTDLDGLPDPWEVQYGTGKALDASASYAYVGKNPPADMKVLPESLARWCREDGFGRMVPTVDGTVSDASEDYDHDGLLNWQEYLVNAMRCWRYDDTISSWDNLKGLDDPIDWGERLVIGGVIRQKNEDGTTSTILAGIEPGTEEYDGQSPYYNPHILVSGTYDIGANWFSLCTNAFDQAAGRWYMFYDGVYHDLTTPDKSKWTVTGGQEMNFNRFTWRSYTLQQRCGNPLFFSATQWGQAADGLYYWGDAEGGNYVVAPKEYPGTDPNLADTDYDGMDDYWELFHGLNPLLGESRSYNNGHRPAVDRVFEAYGGCRDQYPKNGSWIEYPSAENNYWTALNRLEPNSPHFPKAFPDYRTKGNSSYDFHRFPWLNGLAAADPDGDDIRNQQESIQSMLQANASYLHTDPSPLWMTDKSYSYSLTHRYYRPLDIGSYKDPMAPASFTDQFGNEHKWEEFPGFTYNPDEGLVTPRYDFNAWDAPSPSSSKHDNIATIRVSSYGWDFEEDEGYDSDKDYLSDFEEGQSRTKPASNPQDADDPTRRQAMYFGGQNAKSLLQTPLEEGVTAVNDTIPAGVDQPFLYFTVECWAKPEGDLSRNQVLVERTIWSSEANPADENFLRKNFQIGLHGGLWYAKYDSSGTGARDSVEITDGPEVTTNWTHVAATYDGTHLRLYIDGVELRKQPSNLQPEHGFRNASVDYDGTFKEGSDEYGADRRTITVGASVCAYNGINLANKYNSWSCYNQYYQGYIDEVRIWDGARTATEILESYKKRFTAADALDNRQTVFSRWSIGYTREPISSGILPAELKYHWTFDHLPGATQADWVMRQPAGFTTPDDVEDGRAIWSRPDGWAEPWWNSVRLKSLVYDDRAWIPWIVDTVHHLPRFDGTTVDSSYWSENYQGDLSVLGWATNYMGTEAASTYAKFDFQRTHELPSRWTQVTFSDGPPYAIDRRYTLVCKLVEQGAPDGEAMMKSYAFTQRHALKAGYDLLPLGYAFPKRISAAEGGMWDDQGAADAWAQTGNGNDPLVDPTNKGLPDWWTEYYLQQNPELDPDTVIAWDTVVEYNGMRIPAWQAYLRDLAEGLLPDGEKHPEFADNRDMNGNGLPDWWEEFWKLSDTDADGDPDNDGLSTYAEWLATEGAYPYGVTNGFPRLNPTLTYSTPLKVTDYFLAGPTQNLDAAGKHIYAGEYLGEIFSDHDFMEDWWENQYASAYVNSKAYDPLDDKDEDGWSNWAECRATLWGGHFDASIIDRWTGSDSSQHVVCYPEPILGVRATYHGVQKVSGSALVIRMTTGQTPRTDATFVVPSTPDSQTRYIGPFAADFALHGHMSPGHINGNSIVFERAKVSSDKTYTWNCDWYIENEGAQPSGWGIGRTHTGSFETYRNEFLRWPKIELEGGDLSWEPFTEAVENGNVADIYGTGVKLGTANITTGEYELDMSKFDQDPRDYVFRVTYTSRIGYEWPQTVYVSDTKELASGAGAGVAGQGRVREGRNTIEAFMDLDGNGVWDEGEPFGSARNVQVGWHKVPEVVIELRDESPIMPVVVVKSEEEDDAAADDGAAEKPVASTLTKTVRVTRRLVNGISENEGKHLTERQLLTKSVVLDDHPYLTEADVLTVNKPDLDWSWLARDAKKFGIEKIETVTYSVDEVSQLADGTMEEKTLATFVKTFSAARTVATPVSPVANAPVYSASPTFAFAASDTSATGYRLQVRASDGTIIYDSDFRLLPGRTGSTVGKPVYEVTPPIFVNREVIAGVTTNRAVLADGADYQWRVALVNAKYNTVDENSYSPWADFQMDVANRNRYPQQPTGYGLVPLAVRYFGPLAVTNGTIASSNVVVEAYENADFRGQPLAQLRLADIGNIANRANVSATDVILRGIRPGRVFLCAYIDQNQNGVRDRWESWGYANMVGKGMRAIYNPDSYEVSASAADWVNAEKGVAARVIYIEDCDVNQNEKPDCIDSDGDFTADMPYWDEPDTSMSMSEDPLADTDGDGMPDVWEVWNDGVTDPLVADGDTQAEDGTDVMAYLEEMRTMLTLDDGTTEGRRLLLAEGETFNPKDGKVASNYLYTTWYLYGPINDKTQVYGVGTNLVVTNSWPVKSAAEVKVALVHAQVYGKKGYSVLTANPGAFDAGTAVDTKEFTALDRYLVMRYFEAIGATPKDYPSKYKSYEDYALTMGSAEWSKWTLMPGKVDANNDFVADGWQLYVMYGANLVNGVARGDRGKTSPWGGIMDTTKPAPDAGGLTWRQEFDDGGIPSDPWDAYSLYKSLKKLGLLYEGTPEFSDAEAKDRISFEALTSDLDGDNDQITDFQEWQAFLYDRALLAGLNIANAWSDGLTPDYFRNFTNRTDSTTNYLGAAFNGGEWIEPSMRTALGMSGTAGVGTRDYNASGWDYWSVVRNSLHEADTNSVSELSDILPIINSTLNYQGNESQDVIVEAYQATTAYPLYGGQLTAKWTATAEFSGGIARITLDESNLMEGLLRQGPARIVAYIDKDGDGKCSTGDIYTITDTEVGYLGVDLALTLVNGATAALPIIDITAETNGVQTVAIVRTKVNGEYVTPRGVMLRRYENNLSRKVLYPKDFVTDDFIGLDAKLTEDYEEDALDKIDSVTYEIVKIPSSRVIGEGDDDAKISTTNLNHYTVAVLDENGDPALDENGQEITETFDQAVNEEYTLLYPIKRDVPETVIADAASTAGKVAVAFTVPTDRAVTKFWYEISGKTADGTPYSKVAEDKGLLLPDAIGDRIFIDLADYGVFLNEGEYSIRIALGNDKFPERPAADAAAEWSAKATFGVNAANAAAGKISVQVRHALEYVNEGLTNGVTVALYTRADLVNPVLVVTNQQANAAIEIPNLVPGKGYYVAAWYVKNPGDGRDDATVRKPHDSWGYYCTLNVTNETLVALSPAFDPVKIEAVKTVTETNTIYLQDTDWNANGVIDRLENIKSVIGRKEAEPPVVGDLDCDGIMDEDDDDPVFDNADDWLEGDVMAYQTKRMLCVQVGTVDIETNWVWYAVTDLAAETTTNKLDGGTIVIPRGTPANELKSLYTTYVYGRKKSSPYGIGTNVVGLAGQVYHYEWKDVALVHHQVYVENGFDPRTANALLAVSNAVNTKKFLKLDKYIVTNYLAAIGAIAPDADMMNWVLRASDKKTKFNIDTDRDGIPDGWELYTMFGTNAVQALTKTAKNDVLNAWVAGDRNNDPDGDELTNLHEYNGGQEPTDPWSVDTDRDGISDAHAYAYGLKGERYREDDDNDGLSNFQEFLSSVALTNSLGTPVVAADRRKTYEKDGQIVPDYFLRVGSLYLGEILGDHDFIEDWLEDDETLFSGDRKASRYQYDAHADYDGNGWDNWSEARAYLAAGSYTAYDVVTNGSEIVSNAYEISNYTGRPTPTGRIKVVYSGERAYKGNVVVQAYHYHNGQIPPMTVAADETWTIPVGRKTSWYELRSSPDSYLRQGKNMFVVYNDADASGTWTPGEPYGIVTDVDVGYDRIADSIVEITDINPSIMRIDLVNAAANNDFDSQIPLNDRGVNSGSAGEMVNEGVAVGDFVNVFEKTPYTLVRVIRIAVNGKTSNYYGGQNHYAMDTVLERNINTDITPLLTEQLLAEYGFLDLDWDNVRNVGYELGLGANGVNVGIVTYGIVIGDGEINYAVSAADQNILATTFSNVFEAKAEQTAATPVGVSFAEKSLCPTFRWTHNQFLKNYPAFRLRIWNGTTAVYDSGDLRAPVRTSDGVYVWTAPVYVGDKLENGKSYTFSVSMLDAKFTTPNKTETKYAFTPNVNGIGGDLSDQYSVYAAVKYFGPADTNKTIRVEAFESPDFVGLPASATVVRNCNDLMSTNSVTLNAQLIGLEAGKPYYVRAFIDSNENGVKDDIESWGYGNYVDSDRKDLYTPRAYVAKKGSFQMPEAVVYIEDVDRDNNGIPDARADLTAPIADSPYIVTYAGGNVDPVATNLFKAMGDDAALLPFVSQLHSFENGDTFSSFQLYFAMAQGSVPSVDQLKTESDVRVTSFSLEDGIKLAISTRTTIDGKTLLPKVSGLSYSVKIKVKIEFVNDLNGEWMSLGETDPIVVSVNAVSEELDPASLQSVNDAIAARTSSLSGFFKVTAEVAE